MKNTITHVLTFLLSAFAFFTHAQVNEFAPLDDTEKRLANYLNQQFIANGISAKVVSKSLTATARWNAWDLEINKPAIGNCSVYSWSNALPAKWTSYCDTEDADTTPLFRKPVEIANYSGARTVFIRRMESRFPTTASLLTKINSIKPWMSKNASRWTTFGLSVKNEYLVMWFGNGSDANGYHTTGANLSNITGLWFDPALSGSGFNFLTLPNGNTAIIYYGNTQRAGERLWLIADPIKIVPNQTIITDLYEQRGATFSTPKAGTRVRWGTLRINIASCNAGSASISGKDGSVSFNNLMLLVAPDGAECI